MMYPLVLEGPWIWGVDSEGSICTGPIPEHNHFAAYEPWRLKWDEMPLKYPMPPSGLIKDRSKKRDRTVESPASDQNDPSNPPAVAGPPKRTRRTLNLAELTRVKDYKVASSQSTPPPTKHPTKSHKDVVSSKFSDHATKNVTSSSTPPVIEVEESPEKFPKDARTKDPKKMSKDKRRLYEVDDPAYIHDLDFLKDIYASAQQNEATKSPALESLISFCTDTFMSCDQSAIEDASLALTLSQHAALMALIRASRERLKGAKARIQELEKELAEEKNYVKKLEQKTGELRESERSLNNQILHLSREKNDFVQEVSKLRKEISYMNEDMNKMEKDAKKVAKMTRRNAEISKQKLLDDFCDKHGLTREPLELEEFSEDEPSDDEKTLSDEEGNDEDGGGDEEAEDEVLKDKASVPTKSANEPSSPVNPPNQPQGAITGEEETIGAIPLQQRSPLQP